MNQGLNTVIVALDGQAIGKLEATSSSYRFSYFQEYEKAHDAVPLSLSYPLATGSKDYAFAGELPPYFDHLLPEGWLREIAETSRLPMATSLEKLATLCRENLGAVEIYGPVNQTNLTYEASTKLVHDAPGLGDRATTLFTATTQSPLYPPWLHCVWCFDKLPKKGYNHNFHDACALAFFGMKEAPSLNVSSETLVEVARNQLIHRESLTGVQPKFSAVFKKNRGTLSDTAFIVKPEPTFTRLQDGVFYQHSATAELVTMKFIQFLGLPTAETALLYLQDNQPALISKRFDRSQGRKIHIEDMAQALAIRDKYKGSYEKIAALLKKIPDRKSKEQDLQNLLKMILINFVIGNSDSHLKNFSLAHSTRSVYRLSPFYDVLPIRMFALKDPDQVGLAVEGKRSSLRLNDFIRMAIKFGVNTRLVNEYVAEIKINLDTYYEWFTKFGVPTPFVVKLQEYCDARLLDLGVS